MQILDDRQIRQKIKRVAIEIIERNFGEQEVILAGLNHNGLHFGKLLLDELQHMAPSEMQFILTGVHLNPANPLEFEPYVDLPGEALSKKNVIIVDDVANTGRTIFYGIQPFLKLLPKKVEVAVLVDRKHKSFPIKADYVGLALYTTLKDHIDVQIRDTEKMAVYLH